MIKRYRCEVLDEMNGTWSAFSFASEIDAARSFARDWGIKSATIKRLRILDTEFDEVVDDTLCVPREAMSEEEDWLPFKTPAGHKAKITFDWFVVH